MKQPILKNCKISWESKLLSCSLITWLDSLRSSISWGIPRSGSWRTMIAMIPYTWLVYLTMSLTKIQPIRNLNVPRPLLSRNDRHISLTIISLICTFLSIGLQRRLGGWKMGSLLCIWECFFADFSCEKGRKGTKLLSRWFWNFKLILILNWILCKILIPLNSSRKNSTLMTLLRGSTQFIRCQSLRL